MTFEGSLDEYEASWNASREGMDEVLWRAWDDVSLEVRAVNIGLELTRCTLRLLVCVIDREASMHDSIPDIWEVDET